MPSLCGCVCKLSQHVISLFHILMQTDRVEEITRWHLLQTSIGNQSSGPIASDFPVNQLVFTENPTILKSNHYLGHKHIMKRNSTIGFPFHRLIHICIIRICVCV